MVVGTCIWAVEVLPTVAYDTWCVCKNPDGMLKILGYLSLSPMSKLLSCLIQCHGYEQAVCDQEVGLMFVTMT